MALIGNCSHTVYTTHPTDVEEQTITHSDGTTEVIQVPVSVANVTEYTDIYLFVKQVEIFTFFANNVKTLVVHYQYAAYTNLETRNADQEDYLFWNVGQLETHDHETNLYTQIYNEINTLEGLTNLTTD
jgi:hypothetical protein